MPRLPRRTLLSFVLALATLVLIGAYTFFAPSAEAPSAVPPAETAETTGANEEGVATDTSESSSATSSSAATAAPAPTDTKTAAPTSASATTHSAALAPQIATLSIDGGAPLAVRVAEGSTIEEAMHALHHEGTLSFETRSYAGLGSMVTEINGKANTSGYYWILKVNGKKSATGISQTRIRSGDVIEWNYEPEY